MKRKGKAQKQVTAIDLFAGAGGLTLAARELGIRVLAAVENYGHACETYHQNFISVANSTPPRLYRKDIRKLSPKALLSDLNLEEGQLDILMGGPPCQGFSTHRIKDAGVDDPRNDLLLRYFTFVRVLQPKVFVVENVPGLLWPRHAEYLKRFNSLATRARYRVLKPEVLNARDYGVPQNRKRVFLVGFRSGTDPQINWPPPATHGDPESDEVKQGKLKPWVPASTVFAVPLKDNDPNSIHMQHSPALIKVFASTPKNGGSRKDSGRELKCHKGHKGHKDVYGRIDPSKPGPTMTTACINPSKGRFVHPSQNHGIAVRHAARFQGFPECFHFSGGLMAAGVQIGNAVPLALGQQVISSATVSLMIRQNRR